MNLNAKRRKVIFSGLVIALVTAMYVNWYYTRPKDSAKPKTQTTQFEQPALGDAQYVNATVKSSEVFPEAQLKRSKLQDEVKQGYMDVIENKNADEQAKKEAREGLERLNEIILLQGDIETLIKTKTGKNAFVTLSDTAEIILEKGSLDNKTVLQIEDIVVKKSDIPSEKITIIEAK